jgi:hypothetical protein
MAGLSSCALVPAELNLSPIYRHRLDAEGSVLELDVFWPIVHFERTADGGSDFRIRPLYRYVSEPESVVTALPSHEHQYLWPLGRVRHDAEQTTNRLFPLWSYTSRLDDTGQRDTDWYALFPFVWGGRRSADGETYFGVFPFWADLPEFLTYERVLFVMWPLYVRTWKNGRTGHVFLWPFAGFGHGPDGYHWHRILPFYSVAAAQEYRRYSLLWPFVHWGREHLDTEDPVTRWFLWPLYGRQWSERVSGWTFLWPLFQKIAIGDHTYKLDLLWPLFRYQTQRVGTRELLRWWVWPFVARTVVADRHWAWSFVWPLVWWREYADPDGRTLQRWVLPFFWHWRAERPDGADDHLRIWPLFGATGRRDGTGDWQVLAPWPWRGDNATGVEEAYGWLWTLVGGKRRSDDDRSIETVANLFTTRTRQGSTQASVPFLFNVESNADGSGVFRLLQLLPIRWGPSPASTVDPTASLPRDEQR